MTDRHDRRALEERWSAVYLRDATATEDAERTNLHYEQPAELFLAVTGGEWNKYSSNLWDRGATTETESQEHELDLLASLAGLGPGKSVIDVGSGWGGPLCYWAMKHGVSGTGISLSHTQQATASERARRLGVPAVFDVCHWRDYEPDAPVDAVIADEVVVHFHDLEGYFRRARGWLKPGGLLLTKEMHFTSRAAAGASRGSLLVSEIFGDTGNYRLLHEELAMLDRAGFELMRLEQLSLENYRRTVECWAKNLEANYDRLASLADGDFMKQFRTYLRVVRRTMALRNMWTLDIVVARPLA
jgi:cyclopropane-fatty-acyl-phospholipid synthase